MKKYRVTWHERVQVTLPVPKIVAAIYRLLRISPNVKYGDWQKREFVVKAANVQNIGFGFGKEKNIMICDDVSVVEMDHESDIEIPVLSGRDLHRVGWTSYRKQP